MAFLSFTWPAYTHTRPPPSPLLSLFSLSLSFSRFPVSQQQQQETIGYLVCCLTGFLFFSRRAMLVDCFFFLVNEFIIIKLITREMGQVCADRFRIIVASVCGRKNSCSTFPPDAFYVLTFSMFAPTMAGKKKKKKTRPVIIKERGGGGKREPLLMPEIQFSRFSSPLL